MHAHASVESLLSRLAWVTRLRWFAAAGLAALSLTVHFGLGVKLFLPGPLGLAGFVALYNVVFILCQKRLERAAPGDMSFARLERVINLEIALDLVVLTLALHCAGGAENPFLMFYLFHVIIASILLTPRSSYLQATLALGLFSTMALVEYYWPQLHRPLGNYLPMPLHSIGLVVLGEIVALGTTLYIAVYLATTIATRLHLREKELTETRDSLEERSSELAHAHAQLVGLEERKSHFMNLAAHQLRGPLAAVNGCLEGVLGGYAPSPEVVQNLLRRARIRVQSMALLVRDMLALARAREPSMRRERTPVSFDDLARPALELHAQAAREKRVSLRVALASGDAFVQGEERALMDVLNNIVSNAVKYTRAGGSVKVTTRTQGGQLHCKVLDTGIGIPADEMPNLFTDFFRAGNAKTRAGHLRQTLPASGARASSGWPHGRPLEIRRIKVDIRSRRRENNHRRRGI